MNSIHKILLAAFSLFIISCSCSAQNNTGLQKVVIIRHAEKPDAGNNLSCKGMNRALQLPTVLYNKFKVPDKVFAPAIDNGKSANQLRMIQTITPFAVKYNLKIDSRFAVEDTKDLAAAILQTQGYVLVVWEHNKIDNLAKALGVKGDVSKWNDSDFDSIWIITFNNGKPTLTVDKENLNPPDACQ